MSTIKKIVSQALLFSSLDFNYDGEKYTIAIEDTKSVALIALVDILTSSNIPYQKIGKTLQFQVLENAKPQELTLEEVFKKIVDHFKTKSTIEYTIKDNCITINFVNVNKILLIEISQTFYGYLDVTIDNVKHDATFACKDYETILKYIDTLYVFSKISVISDSVDVCIEKIDTLTLQKSGKYYNYYNRGNDVWMFDNEVVTTTGVIIIICETFKK